MKTSSRPQSAFSDRVTLEPLEDRRLFSVFFLSFNSGGDVAGFFSSLPSENLALPQQNLTLPSQPLTLPAAPVVPKSDFNIRGFYTGSITIAGLGSTPLTLTITRQHHGSISGTLTLPTFARTVSGSVPVIFSGNRRFTTTIVQGDRSAALDVRLNRDNSLTGQVNATIGELNFNGTVSLARLSA